MAKPLKEITSISEIMQQVQKDLEPLIHSAAPLLFWGETGAGASFYAKTIHRASRTGKFITIPCFSIDETTVQQRFLGNTDQKGWLEEAHNGTIFFKRVVETPLAAQPTLHHLITTQSVDGRIEFSRKGSTETQLVNVRFMFSAPNDFDIALQEGLLLRDFIDEIRKLGKIIRIPALREHKEDIAEIAQHLLKQLYQGEHSPLLTIDKQAMTLLTTYNWPGNVYELKRVLSSIISTNPGITAISAEQIPEYIAKPKTTGDRYTFKLKDGERFKGKILSHVLRVRRDKSKFRLNSADLVEILRVEDHRFAPPKLKHYAFKLKDGSQIAGMLLDKTIDVETSFDAFHQINVEDLESVIIS